MADASHYVDAPRRSPRRGGIRSVADFRAADRRLGLGGEVQFTSPGCSVAVGDVALCYPTGGDPQETKVLTGVSTLEGIGPVFGVYVGVECWLDGIDYDANARTLLANGSDRAVENAVDEWLATVTPTATVTTFVDGVAAAEAYADANYPGLPVLILNRGDAVRAFADGVLEGDRDGNLWTANGTPVLSSAQITEGTIAITGGISVLEGEVHVHRTRDLPYNTELAIAEQVFAVLVDCEFVSVWAYEKTP